MPNDDAVIFETTFERELEDIAQRRKMHQVKQPAKPSTDPKNALSQDLVGLAFSGGGIRSATFGLGVLQGLAQMKLLKKFDYLSTVSGGGYLGSWFSAWILRESAAERTDPRHNALTNVELQLHPNRAVQDQAQREKTTLRKNMEPEPIRHLRSYSNYLAPRPGLLSVDGWVILATYLRNLLLNQLVFVLLVMGAFFALRFVAELFVLVYVKSNNATESPWSLITVCMGIVIAALVSNGLWCAKNMKQLEQPAQAAADSYLNRRFMWFYCLVPLLVASIAFSMLMLSSDFCNALLLPWKSLVTVGTVIVFALLHSLFNTGSWQRVFEGKADGSAREWIGSGVLAGAAGGLLLYVTLHFWAKLIWSVQPKIVLMPDDPGFSVLLTMTVLPALLLLIFTLTNFVQVGMATRVMRDSHREWWASFGSRILMLAFGWVVFVGMSFFGVMIFLPGFTNSNGSIFTDGLRWLLASSWVGAVVAGIFTAKGKDIGQGKTSIVSLISRVAPFIFIAGYFVLISYIAQSIGYRMNHESDDLLQPTRALNYESYLQHFSGDRSVNPLGSVPLAAVLIVLAVAFSALSALLSIAIDVNIYSMHGMYTNRLVRCYLGASRKKQDNLAESFGMPTGVAGLPRTPNFLTGFDPADDFALSTLRRSKQPVPNPAEHQGPLHLINTALNLTGGEELAWQERQAESFVMTPYYCGSISTGYCPTDNYANQIKIGTAVALSGAAANPNMGFYTTSAVSMMLTLFNVRMGGWLGNPRQSTWKQSSPRYGLAYLLKEMFTRTTSDSDFVQISDGGHFDNLGIYELIRRRVRFIVLSDAGADPEFALPCLGNMIRKVRIDFGIRIDLDVEGVRPKADTGYSASHVVVGRIRYSDADGAPKEQSVVNEFDPTFHYKENDGILLYIKPCFTGDESSDLLNYRRNHPTFPHESTLDQFYSESQFESYRALGFHAITSAFEPVRKPGEQFEEIGTKEVRDIFEMLYKAWFNRPRSLQPLYFNFNTTYLEIQNRLGADAKYTQLEQEINGIATGQANAGSKTPAQISAERTMVIQMLTLLENVFFGLNFENEWELKSNLGWKGVFEQWFKSPTFREHYLEAHLQFSREFRTFTLDYHEMLSLDQAQCLALARPLGIPEDLNATRPVWKK